MSGITADSEKPSGTRHAWCRARVGTTIALFEFCVKSSFADWARGQNHVCAPINADARFNAEADS